MCRTSHRSCHRHKSCRHKRECTRRPRVGNPTPHPAAHPTGSPRLRASCHREHRPPTNRRWKCRSQRRLRHRPRARGGRSSRPRRLHNMEGRLRRRVGARNDSRVHCCRLGAGSNDALIAEVEVLMITSQIAYGASPTESVLASAPPGEAVDLVSPNRVLDTAGTETKRPHGFPDEPHWRVYFNR